MMEIRFTARAFPFIDSPVFVTDDATPYLKSPGVAMIARPEVDLDAASGFLHSFPSEFGFHEYLKDPDPLPPSERLVKFLGQVCYLSLGPQRTPNSKVGEYLQNIKSSGHGSVTEHANFSFLFWGIDRSVTHELVRHRAGFGFSQVSQRYVDGSRVRFVERPEYQVDRLPKDAAEELVRAVSALHENFEAEIDLARAGYEDAANHLASARELGHPMLQGGNRTEIRKQVNQVARECLPNCTEAPIGVTANVRAWRHFLEMRANAAADVQIRELAMRVYACLRVASPVLFGDYEVVDLPSSATQALQTSYRKV